MPDTATRPLPTDRQLLRAFLPAEPDDSGVSRALAGRQRLEQLVAASAAALDEHDRMSRAAVTALADAAMDGDNLAPQLAALVTDERPVLVEELEQLRAARAIITQREWNAQTNDPAYVAWTAACQQVTREWERCMAAETDDERFSALVTFTERHRPS